MAKSVPLSGCCYCYGTQPELPKCGCRLWGVGQCRVQGLHNLDTLGITGLPGDGNSKL